MQSIGILCVGKLKEKFYIQAAEEYQKRLQPFCKLELRELAEFRLPERASDAQIQIALQKEGKQILELLPKSGAVVALCIEGKGMSSGELAQWMAQQAVEGGSRVTFLIGGSYGLSDEVKQRADLRLSMSRMTFPHHLARILLLEQIYRSFQITEGTKYHK